MTLNLEPIGLPNVAPSSGQYKAGHLLVGAGFAATLHFKLKAHPLVSLIGGCFAGWVHKEMDAPVSQVIAGVAAVI